MVEHEVVKAAAVDEDGVTGHVVPAVHTAETADVADGAHMRKADMTHAHTAGVAHAHAAAVARAATAAARQCRRAQRRWDCQRTDSDQRDCQETSHDVVSFYQIMCCRRD